MIHTDRQTRADSASMGQYLDLTIPYWFSSMARRRQENLLPGDYVAVRGLGKDKKFELVDVFPQFGSCRVRAIGEIECLLIPWAYVSPWTERRTSALTQVVGNWLFRGSRVYRLAEPDRMLKQRKINWNTHTCDLEDEEGTVFYDVSWDDLEFADDLEYHLPDDD